MRRANASSGTSRSAATSVSARSTSASSASMASSSRRAASQSRPVAATRPRSASLRARLHPVLEVRERVRLLRLRRWRRRHCRRLFLVRGPVALSFPVRPARALSRLVLGDAARGGAGEQHQTGAQGVRRGRDEREEADPHGFGWSSTYVLDSKFVLGLRCTRAGTTLLICGRRK